MLTPTALLLFSCLADQRHSLKKKKKKKSETQIINITVIKKDKKIYNYMQYNIIPAALNSNAEFTHLFVSLSGASLLKWSDFIRTITRNPHVPLSLCETKAEYTVSVNRSGFSVR